MGEVPQEKLDQLFTSQTCHSLLKQKLSKDLFTKLKDQKTRHGGTIHDCIRSGCENLDSGVGIYASDPEAYTVFAPVLDEVIKEYHHVRKIEHPKPDFGDVSDWKDLDPSGQMIVSTRVRVARTHAAFGFPPVLNKEKRKEMEEKTVAALEKLEEELKGTYFSLCGMCEHDEHQLIEDHFLFKNDDRFLKAACGYDDWPTGRGIFHNPQKTFLVWVNEEDHLRFISMQKGGNLKEVYQRLVKAINALEKELTFARDDRLGYLTFCPSNLGTTLRASVHIKIPRMEAEKEKYVEEFCEKRNLQARGVHGEHTKSEGGMYDISNKRRLGLTEIQAITEMRDGVLKVIEEERRLADSGGQMAKK